MSETNGEGLLPRQPRLDDGRQVSDERINPKSEATSPAYNHADHFASIHTDSVEDLGLNAVSDQHEKSDVDDDERTYVPYIPPLTSPRKDHEPFPRLEGEEGESAEPAGLLRVHSPFKIPSSGAPTIAEGREHLELHQMHKFSLYETLTRYYLVGSDILDRHYRVLKIDRTAPPGQLSITEDETVYSKREINQLLNTIEDGNRAVGGMRYRGTSWGLLGFIRFTEAYYMLLIKKKLQVATIGGHYIFQVEDTDVIPLTTGSSSNFRGNRNAEENRFLTILGNLDLHRNFYFSYSYNLTRTLQQNIISGRRMVAEGKDPATNRDFNDMFVWNQHLLHPAVKALNNPFDWCMPITHGFIDQAGELSQFLTVPLVANTRQQSTCMDATFTSPS